MAVVKLTAHRNTKRQRRAKGIITEAHDTIRTAQQEFGHDAAGYLTIVWDDDGSAICHWKNRAIRVNSDLLGEFAKRKIERASNKLDIRDALNPPDESG